MDSSPAKRLKLASDASVPASGPKTGLRSTSRDGPRTPSRASFMSPTKASLSRFNPGLLRPRSAGEEKQTESNFGPVRHLSQPPKSPSRLSPSRLNAVALRPTALREPQERLSSSFVLTGSISPRRSPQRIGNASRLSASPRRRRSRTPGQPSVPKQQAFEGSITRTMNMLERSPLASTEEAVNTQLELDLQADAAQQSDATSPILSRDQRRVRRREEEEPELPPTPEQLGLEPLPRQRQGLLESSPSARILKRKVPEKSSPLKPRDANRQLQAAYTNNRLKGQLSGQGQELLQWSALMGGAVGDEPAEVLQQKELLKQLNGQVKAMEADLRYMKNALTATQNPASPPDGEELTPETKRMLIDIITSANPTHKPMPVPLKPPPLSSILSRFLPFSKRSRKVEKPPTGVSLPLPSYRPLSDEKECRLLPGLMPSVQTLSETIVDGAPDEKRPLQRQQTVRIVMPSSLLSLEVAFVVDTSRESVASSSLVKITRWADKELGSWIRATLLEGDVSATGWACGRYWNIAILRAKVWASCCKKYPQLLGRLGKEQLHEETTSADSQSKVSRVDIQVHLGRQTLTFSHSGVSLFVTWSIGFDWTGEAESQVSARASVPQEWSDADERRSLEKVGGTFSKLAQERGVSEAVRIIVHILFRDTMT